MQFDPDLIRQVRQVVNSGYAIKPETQKLGPMHSALSHDIPWIFIKPAYQPHCDVWNALYWQTYGLIPQFCRVHCHKVVAKPRNVSELFILWELMESLSFPSKLGIDKRDYTFGPYAAFFYTVNLKEGLQRYQQVREAVDLAFPNPETFSVILKKGCTEMEHKLFKGKASTEWGKPNEADVEREMMLNDIHELRDDYAPQPEWLKNMIALTWLAASHAIGDPSYYDVCERFGIGDVFGDPPKTYEHLIQTQNGRNHAGKEVNKPRKAKVANIKNAKKRKERKVS
jgi:hypothetical protein